RSGDRAANIGVVEHPQVTVGEDSGNALWLISLAIHTVEEALAIDAVSGGTLAPHAVGVGPAVRLSEYAVAVDRAADCVQSSVRRRTCGADADRARVRNEHVVIDRCARLSKRIDGAEEIESTIGLANSELLACAIGSPA